MRDSPRIANQHISKAPLGALASVNAVAQVLLGSRHSVINSATLHNPQFN